jgi:hypothetical protein
MKFIANALSTDPNARLVHWAQVRPGRWVCSRDFRPEKAVPVADMSEDLKNADIIVLNGVTYAMLKPFEEEIIRRIESGQSGLLLLPSTQGFADGGFAATAFEKLLPVDIAREIWRGNPGNMVLPSLDVPYNFLRLVDNPVENSEFFATLPKLEGAYEYASIKPGTEILVNSTIRGSTNVLPVLLKSRSGQGNVVMFTGGPLWPMGFRLVPTDRGFAPFSAMMVNMCKWLANRREDAQVSIELPSSRGYVGQTAIVKVWVMDSKHQMLSNAQVSLNIKDEKGTVTVLPAMETSDKGCYEAAFVPAFRGLHQLEAEARFHGQEVGRALSELLVETPTAEFDEPVVKETLMQQLASDTGGVYAAVDQADKILAALNPVAGKKLESRTIDVRDSWVLLLLLLVLPMLEWYLRRTRGLS